MRPRRWIRFQRRDREDLESRERQGIARSQRAHRRINSVKFSPDGQRVAAGSDDGTDKV